MSVLQQIERLETQYKGFEKHNLKEISVDIVSIKSGENHQPKLNSIYVPRIGNSPVVDSLERVKLKHHNYYQVELIDGVDAGYVAAFFKSQLGRLALESLSSKTFIPHLNKGELGNALVAIPSAKEQKQISTTLRKLDDLKRNIEEFESELALNPTSSQTILEQLDSMLQTIGMLSTADEVLGLARQGESKNAEFKESLSLDVKKKTKEKYIELASLKTIVAFMNSDGGSLLIGVSDEGILKGVDFEIEKLHKGSVDKMLLHLKNLIKYQIGEEFYPFINSELVGIDGARIIIVKVQSSKEPCFLNKTDFYVRTNPATDKLEGLKVIEYIKNHFGM